MLPRLSLLLGLTGILAIIVLSVVPIELRPHVLAVSQYEHVAAYALTAAALALGFRRLAALLMAGIVLSLLAGVLEVVQLWVPGRDARIIDWAAGSFGAWAGTVVVLILFWLGRSCRRSLP